MEIILERIRDTFELSYDAYEDSRIEDREIHDMYHNRQFNDEELRVLIERGQPKETFNVIKMFSDLLVGYYSTVVNTVSVAPRQQSDTELALLLNDLVKHTMQKNEFETEGDKVKLDCMLSGIMCVHLDVVDTEETDEYGRTIRDIQLKHVPIRQIVLDPMSEKEDYSDARWIHRFKWVTEEHLTKLIENSSIEESVEVVLGRLVAYDNHVNRFDSEFESNHSTSYRNDYVRDDSYLLVHSVVVDDEGRRWSILWSSDVMIDKVEITHDEVKFPYRIQKLRTSNTTEYYGLFRPVRETQRAINQAVIKIQTMVNGQKVFVAHGAVDDIDKFSSAVNRVNAIIPVINLDGVRIENTSQAVLDQYVIIDRALDRIQKVLGVNDSFLGTAFASDSGRKVRLQQNSTVTQLRATTTKIQQFYRLLAKDILNLIKQYYTATQAIRVADDIVGARWVEINSPIQLYQGQDEFGNPVTRPLLEEVIDPETGEPMRDEDDNIIVAPVPEQDTFIAFSDFDVEVDTVPYNNEDERNQQLQDNLINGTIGNALLAANPAAFFKLSAQAIKGHRTKESYAMAAILEQTTEQLTQQQTAQAAAVAAGTGGSVPGAEQPQQPASERL